jgi:hypothetical protein
MPPHLQEYIEVNERAREIVAERTEAEEKAALEMKKTATEMGMTVGEYKAHLAEQERALEEAKRAHEKYVSDVCNGFQEIVLGSGKNLDEMIGVLQGNQKAVDEWQENLNILAKAGVSEGIIKELEKGGVQQMGATVAAMAGELGGIADVLEENMDDAQLVLKGKVEELNSTVGQSGEGMTREYSTSIEDGMPQVISATEHIVEETAKVFREDESVEKEAIELIQRLHDALVEAVEAADFPGIGRNITKGLEKGMLSGFAPLIAAAEFVITGVMNVLKSIPRVQSPSKETEEIGRFLDEGLAVGITGNKDKVIKAVEQLFSGVEGSMKNGVKAAVAVISEMMDGVENVTKESYQDLLKAQIAQIDAYLNEESRKARELARMRDIEAKEKAIHAAKTATDREKAEADLNDALKKYYIEDLKEHQAALKERQREIEKQTEAQLKTLSDVKYTQAEFHRDEEGSQRELTRVKIELFHEEYINKVRAIDEGLADFLDSNNKEIQAIIDRIGIEDEATAKRLQNIQDERDRLQEEARREREAFDEKARREKEQELRDRPLGNFFGKKSPKPCKKLI